MIKNNNQFLFDVENKLDKEPFTQLDFSSIKNFPLNSRQCIYVVDWQSSKLTYKRNIKSILGYEDEDFDLPTLLNIAHPKDLDLIKRITQAVVNNLVNRQKDNLDFNNSSQIISYRFRKKDGTFVKLLRQSTLFERTDSGLMKSNLSLLTDISFFDKSDTINWEFEAPELEQKAFRNEIYKEFSNFFTKRETEVIRLIGKGMRTRSIAEQLFISEHTAYSHRKNILRKSNCHNAKELTEFCNKIGVL